jgi:hypothetical protein
MAVAHDAVSESHTGTTGHSGSTSFTWNHVPTGTPRSALVFIDTIGDLVISSVTYGSVNMTAVPYIAADTDTEPGYVSAWFLDNCGTGTKAVVVNRTNSAIVAYATCMTQTAASATEVYTAGVKTIAAAGTEQTAASSGATGVSSSWSSMTLTDGSPGTNSIRYMAVHNGSSSVSAASTNTTTNGTNASIDFGLYTFATYRETTPSQGAKALTITTAISDDLAVIGLAVRETPPSNILCTIPVLALVTTVPAPSLVLAATYTVPLVALALTGLAPDVTVAAGSTNTTYTVDALALSLTGLTPSLVRANRYTVPVAALTVAGLAPSLVRANTYTVPVSALTVAGLAPSLVRANRYTVPVAALTVAGLAPSLVRADTLTVPVATLMATGLAPSLVRADTYTSSLLALVLAAPAPSIISGLVLVVPVAVGGRT